jgi:hypothetical protein
VQDALGGQEVPGGGEHAEEPGGGQSQIPQGACLDLLARNNYLKVRDLIFSQEQLHQGA